MMNCHKCGNVLQPDAIFCDQCGTPVAQATEAAPEVTEAPQETVITRPSEPLAAPQPTATEAAVCPNCGAQNTPGEMFCADCGTPLEAPAPDAAAALETSAPGPVPVDTSAAEPVTQKSTQTPSPSETPGENRCPACGAAVDEGDAFCYACGANLSATPAPEPVEQPPAEPTAETPPTERTEQETVITPTEPTEAEPRTECPSCGAAIEPGDVFCEFCGASLVETPPPAVTAAPQPSGAGSAEVSEQEPKLVVGDGGTEIPLPQGTEVLVGREDPYSNVYPDVDLTPYGAEEAGVSRRHFKITLADGQYAIQDLDSTNYTWLNRRRLEPGVPVQLADGDEIRAGRLRMVFRIS